MSLADSVFKQRLSELIEFGKSISAELREISPKRYTPMMCSREFYRRLPETQLDLGNQIILETSIMSASDWFLTKRIDVPQVIYHVGEPGVVTGVSYETPSKLRKSLFGGQKWVHAPSERELVSMIRCFQYTLAEQLIPKLTATYEDALEKGYCHSGIAEFCTKHGLDQKKPVKLSKLMRTKDSYAKLFCLHIAIREARKLLPQLDI